MSSDSGIAVQLMREVRQSNKKQEQNNDHQRATYQQGMEHVLGGGVDEVRGAEQVGMELNLFGFQRRPQFLQRRFDPRCDVPRVRAVLLD